MKDIRMLESVQKFACKVCLKCWDMDYDNICYTALIYLVCQSGDNISSYSQCIILSMVICFFQKVFLYFTSIFPLGIIHLSTADHVHTQIIFFSLMYLV